jgi:hypothetical protein
MTMEAQTSRPQRRVWLPELRDLFVLGGLGLASYGTWLVFEPAGYILAGAGLFFLGRWSP